jgi:putative oxidoreductase
MELGLLVLRLVVGLLFMGHGAQKLFGMFGGHGLAGTAGFFEQGLGLRPGKVHAGGAGAAEFFGGLLLALGLLTPFAAAALIGTMTVAIITVHWSKGVWSTEGGYEYNAVLMAVAFAVTATGPGKWSLDHALSIDANGKGWALGALAAGVIGGALMWTVGKSLGRSAAEQPVAGGAGSTTTA